MKRLFSALLLFLLSFSLLKAQIVTSEPEFPTAGKAVTIYFDATKGTGELEGYDGTVYAHTGVITDQSSSSSDWKYVVADWGENIPKIQMERVEENRYKLEITPSIREYYGVPEAETIKQLAFVFRNEDGSLEGKAEGGADIFLEVYQDEFNVKILEPAQNPAFQKIATEMPITGIASSQNSDTELTLWIDNQQVKTAANDTIHYTHTATAAGNFEIMLTGSSESEQDTVFNRLVVYPQQSDRNRPANLNDGITYVNNSTVRLSLFAPYKEFVYVIGDFNNWEIQSDYIMNRDSVNADSIYYWIEIDGLDPGREYGFQYLVDGKLRVADPYSHKILDPVHDPAIPESIYPNLKPYPQDETSKIMGVLQPGKKEYEWQITDYDRPDEEKLVVYELLVRDFLKQHDYKTLTDTLDYLGRLGVNAIELMPVMEFDANSSWGYNPTFHLAADKYYGPAEDLKRFIDEAHSRDMAVILDMVLNHAWGPSPLVRLWNDGDYGKPTAQNPYLNTEPRHDFNVGYDFNHESAATQYFVDRVNEYWLREFKFDGFRFDLSKGFTQKNTLGSINAWGQYDASRVRILKRMADQIWAVDDSAYIILEHFADNREEKVLSEYGMLLWGNMNHQYNEATMGYHEESNFSGVLYSDRNWNNAHLLGYMESHDEQRLMFKNLQYGNSSGNYDITERNTALNRVKMAGAFFFTIPGPKMIWQFGELGYDISIDQNGRTGEKPIKWEYFIDAERRRLYNTFQALIRLRKSHPAFTSGESDISLELDGALKRFTIDHPDMEVSIVGNFGVNAGDLEPAFNQNGTWYEFFSGDTLNITNTDTTLNLEPGEFHVYTTQKFEQPKNIFAGSDKGPDGGSGSTGTFQVYQNYPNPFNDATTVPFELAESASVTIKLYDILGQEVWRKNLGEQPAGPNKVDINLSNLSSGVYIYRLKAGAFSSSRQMLFIK